jgi:predicted DCC family thiol-disulfide oxidoreductase YuxK
VRWLFDRCYAFVAAHRYRWWGRSNRAVHCDSGTCSHHTRSMPQ